MLMMSMMVMMMMMMMMMIMMMIMMIGSHDRNINTLRCMIISNNPVNLGMSLASFGVWGDSTTLLQIILS